MRSILYQILGQDMALFPYFIPSYREVPPVRDSHRWRTVNLIRILESVSASGVAVICVVDAMDESEDSHNQVKSSSRSRTMLSFFSRLVSASLDARIKFVMLSRPDPFIEVEFRRIKHESSIISTYRIVLEQENTGDIELIINKGLKSIQRAIHTCDSDQDDPVSRLDVSRSAPKSKKHKGLPARHKDHSAAEDAELQKIRSYLVANANGVFLWVTLIIADLETQATNAMTSIPDLEARLVSLPLRLDDLYRHILGDLKTRLSAEEFEKARTALMIVSGSASMGRPIMIRELWDALAVPKDIETAIRSEQDPIKHSRALISSWNDFRRQLHRKCGPLMEFISNVEESVERSREDTGPDDIVQLIHRTVKDFLESPNGSGQLHYSESHAENKVKEIAGRYASITFPAKATPYAPPMPVSGGDWHDNIAALAKYFNERYLLSFIFAILPDKKSELLGSYGFMFDDSVSPSLRSKGENRWTEDKIRDKFSHEMKYYPWHRSASASYTPEAAWTVVVGHAFRYSCSHGLVTASKNFIEVSSICRSKKHALTIRNRALLAAIDRKLVRLTKLLTQNSAHQGSFLPPIWETEPIELSDAFVHLAIVTGDETITKMLVDQAFQNRSRNNLVYHRTVTSTDLSLYAEAKDSLSSNAEALHNCLEKARQFQQRQPPRDHDTAEVVDVDDVEEAISAVIHYSNSILGDSLTTSQSEGIYGNLTSNPVDNADWEEPATVTGQAGSGQSALVAWGSPF